MTYPGDPTDPVPAVRLDRVTKRFGPQTAVADVTLDIRRGEVFGLLGPNGAGKTTTLRMLLGLVRPTSGAVTVLGAPPGEPAVLARIGAIVEEPALYPYLSGRANLAVLARYRGATGRGAGGENLDAALAAVGLSDRGDDKVRGYSLGMRQRLGVAAALMGEPQLLILDEPTNGLDPQGMASMRALIRSLGTGQRTVIVSSHLLGEVEQICDRVAVLRSGELIAVDDVASLRGASALLIRARPPDRAAALLRDLPGVEAVDVDPTEPGTAEGGLLRVTTTREAAALNRALVEAGVEVSELRAAQRSLEDAFMSLTGTETIA